MKVNTRKFARSKLYLGLSAALALTACGGTGQDDGTVSTSTTTFSGTVVDGYLARATVFIDSNNNGTRESWEPFAFTDNAGYYSYNPVTDVNYCAPTATAEEMQYCLSSVVDYSNVVVRIDGGYDVLTGEPFLGQMSRRVDASTPASINNSLITPISSLVANVQDDNDRATLLNSIGIVESDLDVDYLNTDGAGTINAALLKKALNIHKVVAVLSDRLTDTYDEIGENFGTPNDASRSVYPNLAEQILNSGNALEAALADPNVLVAALDSAETELREIYERKDFDLPADLGNVANPGAFQRVIDVSSQIGTVLDSLIDENDITFDLDDARGGARALESLIIKAVENENDTTIDNAIDFFENNTALVDALITNLSLDIADVSSLANNDFSGTDFDSVDEINTASTLGNDVEAFTQIGGMQFRVTNLDLGSAPSNLDDHEVEIYFNGAANDLSGSFQACVKYIDGASSDGTLGEGNTRGELIDGFWSLLGATTGNVESYSLLITLEFLGATYQAIMKPGGQDVVDTVTYNTVRFDLDGDFRVFHSEDGITALSTIPTTNAECEARLPPRHPELVR